MADLRLPGMTHRLLTVGRTGSGKTVGSVWHLSQYPIHKYPFIVINSKRDELIDSIPGVQFIDLDHKLDHKMKPGVYVVHPMAKMDDDALEAFMWRIHARGNMGIYADEGYMIPSQGYHAFRALLTQGRSLQIPMLINSQRPLWIDRFAVSESDFYRVYTLNSKRDRQVINDFIPGVDLEILMASPPNQEPPLPIYHSVYRDVGKNRVVILQPAPKQDIILGDFAVKLAVKKRRYSFF